MIIDPTTPVGKIRLRVGDWLDLPILSDAVIESALAECNDSIPRAAALCANYILAILTHKTHKKMAQLETWSDQQFDNYVKFIRMTINNPHHMGISPIPYNNTGDGHPIIDFIEEWNSEYSSNKYLTL
jgi:hypothetical protein